MDAFDSDVLIYAAAPEHPLGTRVAALFADSREDDSPTGIGSYILLPEVLARPARLGYVDEERRLKAYLARLDLRPLDAITAQAATRASAAYKLKAADATHLATAIVAGADRFITNNRRDFPKTISDIEIVYPDDLPEPPAGSAQRA